MGEKGSLYVGPDETFHTAAFPVQAVDTTAAGDAFTAALAAGIADKLPIREALRRASAVGALTCTKRGAQPSLPNKNEVEDFLRL
jgi:ribokinase